jgi:lantibiotic transport system ATP-binding protein
MQPWIIETAGLTRHYGRITPVQKLDMQVPTGSIFGFLGPNGAGKTTTIRMLLGLIVPSQGDVRVFGMPLADNRVTILKQVGALVETPTFFGHLTGYENLEYLCRLRGLSLTAIPFVLKTVGLTDAAGRKAVQYSLGMKQRLGIAAALVSRPKLLVLDEPTNGLDPSGIREVRELMRRLVDEHGITIFLSSHLLIEVEQVVTHVGIIDQGCLRFQGSLAELSEQSRPSVLVRVDNPEKAVQLLRQAYPGVSVENEDLDVPSGQENSAAICRELVLGGVNVSRLAPQSVTLEALFLRLTENRSKIE